MDHPDLQNNKWKNTNEISCDNGIDDDGNGFIDDCQGYNHADGSGTVLDGSGSHGSHCAGTIAADSDNGVGVAGVAGGKGASNPGASLMINTCFGQYSTGGFGAALLYGGDHGAHVSSNSWGYTAPGVYDPSVIEAIDYAVGKGVIVVFAAGNDYSDDEWCVRLLVCSFIPSIPSAVCYRSIFVLQVSCVSQQHHRSSGVTEDEGCCGLHQLWRVGGHLGSRWVDGWMDRGREGGNETAATTSLLLPIVRGSLSPPLPSLPPPAIRLTIPSSSPSSPFARKPRVVHCDCGRGFIRLVLGHLDGLPPRRRRPRAGQVVHAVSHSSGAQTLPF